jgi:hypothetical protein
MRGFKATIAHHSPAVKLALQVMVMNGRKVGYNHPSMPEDQIDNKLPACSQESPHGRTFIRRRGILPNKRKTRRLHMALNAARLNYEV